VDSSHGYRQWFLSGRDHGVASILAITKLFIVNRGGWEVIEENKARARVSKPFGENQRTGSDANWIKLRKCGKNRVRWQNPLLYPGWRHTWPPWRKWVILLFAW